MPGMAKPGQDPVASEAAVVTGARQVAHVLTLQIDGAAGHERWRTIVHSLTSPDRL